MELLNVKNLSIGYTSVLQKDINFSVESGDLLCINGKNGKGKTTLFKTLIGNVRALDGKVRLNIPKREIAYLPQIISHEIPLSITLNEILDSFGVDGNVKELFSVELLKRRWGDSSGGEKQKVLIGTQLNKKNKVLLLDEPFNHIDKESIDDLLIYFRKIIDEKLIDSVVYISHVSSPLLNQLRVKTLELN